MENHCPIIADRLFSQNSILCQYSGTAVNYAYKRLHIKYTNVKNLSISIPPDRVQTTHQSWKQDCGQTTLEILIISADILPLHQRSTDIQQFHSFWQLVH